ncbi:PD40 domain-containing protein [Xanthovirga aplysinae]|uniref:PD40 domain-containing protein n=1 Tax=Xanthovirga aplysinae TaxID=2529853 RepID=UPI0012BCE4B5|nr:PD40 domain-containing protein [Xanthovirga aplysinae]MTI30307.1 hypothetical protein [Xanthovirga aplysinae]
MKVFHTLFFCFLMIIISCSSPKKREPYGGQHGQDNQYPLVGDYFGFKADEQVKVFAPGVISRGFQELNAAFSPNKKEFFFTIADPLRDYYTIIQYEKKKGVWEGPTIAPFSGKYSDADPFFSPDGKRLYFISRRPSDPADIEPEDFDIWYVDKKDGKWSAALNVGAPINTKKNEFYVSVSKNNNIYFSAAYDHGHGRGDIYKAVFQNGTYKVVNMGDAINSPLNEGDPYISPEEDFLIFTSWGRTDGMGRGDLYISFFMDGKWTKAVNMGPEINSEDMEYCPIISPDGEYFFFTSYRKNRFYSFKKKTYDNYIKRLSTYDNGLGNIYWVDSDFIWAIRNGLPD